MTDDLKRWRARGMAWMRPRTGRLAAGLWFPWFLLAILPSLVLLSVAPFFDGLSLWTALPGGLLVALCLLAQIAPRLWRPALGVACTACLVPGAAIVALAGRGAAAGAQNPFGADLHALTGGRGRWLATNAHGLVVLTDADGREIPWRRIRPTS